MGVVVHLSDLHLLSGDPESERVLACLVAALEADRAARDRRVDLIVVTGDVFDTSTLDPTLAVREVLALHENLQRVLGRGERVPTVIVPGNHDRRRMGLFGPHRAVLFDALRAAAPPELWVHGGTPHLAEVVPHAFHGLPVHLVAYDSSYLPTGYLSAGGNVRSEDLLHAVARIGDEQPEWPLILLLHHHLVPTPVTDTGPIETHRLSRLAHTSLHRILPVLVTHADREELTMTAMGAGSVLSLLHSFERAVLVLHGHKHIASARKLDGMRDGEGDVILASAGSAATAQRWSARADEQWSGAPHTGCDPVRIWPSFNVVELDDAALAVETVSFGWKGRSAAQLASRPLVWAERLGARWRTTPTTAHEPRMGPALASNGSLVQLRTSHRHGRARFDSRRVRALALGEGRTLSRYQEVVDGLADGSLVQRDHHGRIILRAAALPASIDVPLSDSTELDVLAAVPRTVEELRRTQGAMAAPFPTVTLFNRYATSRASLTVEGLGEQRRDAFASLLDLGSGRERPLRVHHADGDDRVVVEVERCPARSVVRLHWSAHPTDAR
ncbi:MAG: metallophosphoesterase [Deltaproteobacteria bacterium]|nr:metallophosphoesterase [Deltaproteobacteria bacterium]